MDCMEAAVHRSFDRRISLGDDASVVVFLRSLHRRVKSRPRDAGAGLPI